MTPELEAIRKRLKAATPGHWEYMKLDRVLDTYALTFRYPQNSGAALKRDDAELIANAPTDLRKLIACVEIAENRLAQIEQHCRLEHSRGEVDAGDAAREARTAMALALKGEE